ncbi:unnamed protein product [Clavelina lepadiformis]|uniref:Uncharacterized protein n=1 Tax=Clavelina lepadiformis TaxID=159417 RepID=A0ABP0GLN1_CLALP
MAGKQMVLLHSEGIESCEQNDWLKAVAIFQQIETPSSIIFFNIGCCYLQLKQYNKAEDAFKDCVAKDHYLAVGYYQLGVAQTYLKDYAAAIDSFKSCHNALRGNSFIHYKQLNMVCKVYDCDVRLNLALLYLFTGDVESASHELNTATTFLTETENQPYIKKALNALSTQNWDVFGETPLHMFVTLDSTCLFKPSKAKLEGIKSEKKFMSSAKLVSATNDEYSFVGFVGPVKLQRQKENEIGLPPEQNSGVCPPPLPSVAPPRRIKQPDKPPPQPPTGLKFSSAPLDFAPTPPSPLWKHKKVTTLDLRNIPSPPSVSPPPLQRPVRPLSPGLSRPKSPFKKLQSKKNIPPPPSIAAPMALPPDIKKPIPRDKPFTQAMNKIIKPIPSRPLTPPKPKPVQPATSFDLPCSVTISFNLPSSNILTYTSFRDALCTKLKELCENLQSVSNKVEMSAGSDAVIDKKSWRDVYQKSLQDSQLNIQIKHAASTPSKKNVVGNISPAVFKLLPNLKQASTPSSPEEVEEDLYVDANAHQMYIEPDEDEETYSTAVFSG